MLYKLEQRCIRPCLWLWHVSINIGICWVSPDKRPIRLINFRIFAFLDSSLIRIANIFQEVIPGDVTPVSNSVLMQILVSALYSSLVGKLSFFFHLFESQIRSQNSLKLPKNFHLRVILNTSFDRFFFLRLLFLLILVFYLFAAIFCMV